MASTAKEDTGQSSRSHSRPPRTAPPESEEDSQCPICLGHMREPAYVAYCMHKFCLKCIRLWTRAKDNCPLCRQPIHQMLYSVQGGRYYREHTIDQAARLQRMAGVRGLPPGTAAMLRMIQAHEDQQHLYGRRRPRHTERAQRQEAVPGPSNAHSYQTPAAYREMTARRERRGPAGPAAPLEPQNGTE